MTQSDGRGGHILAIDQGTTGTTSLVMSTTGETLGRENFEFPQYFPELGWVEHDPEEIWESVRLSVRGALAAAGVQATDISAVGITNQRETTVLWQRSDSRPVHRAIVWQDRRTAGRCQELREAGELDRVREVTGLLLDPYFSGTKVEWILDHVDGARTAADEGKLAFGTVDSFLIWRMTGGQVHATDATNASRTLLMRLDDQSWNAAQCQLLRIPESVLPKILPSAADFGVTRGLDFLPDGVPISGVAGDQHAALFGQACFAPGEVKTTYGTGAFAIMNTGSRLVRSRHGLLTTLAWKIGDEAVYALEGSTFVAGAAVQWLRDGLGIIDSAPEIEELALSVEDCGGVVFVPALAGLGAPHWDADARGLITGITRGTTKAHLARATLEAIALQVTELTCAMAADLESDIPRMRVDGGAAANDLLMQMQSDFSGLTVDRPAELESTARGAAMFAGIGAGLFSGPAEAGRMAKTQRSFEPELSGSARSRAIASWDDAVRRSRSVAPPRPG